MRTEARTVHTGRGERETAVHAKRRGLSRARHDNEIMQRDGFIVCERFMYYSHVMAINIFSVDQIKMRIAHSAYNM